MDGEGLEQTRCFGGDVSRGFSGIDRGRLELIELEKIVNSVIAGAGTT